MRKTLCWHGTGDIRVENVLQPKSQEPRDAIIRIASSGICGSAPHLLNGFVPTMKAGDILGHESMSEGVEVAKSVTNLKLGNASECTCAQFQGSSVA